MYLNDFKKRTTIFANILNMKELLVLFLVLTIFKV